MQPIILASQSPRRSQLLTWAEIPFTIKISDTDESFPPGLSFEETAIHIARNKALAVASLQENNEVVLAADTIVVLNDRIIGKPTDREDAISILKGLSGATHEVITGVVLYRADKEISFADRTRVHFHELSEDQIIFYVDNYKPFDKAGAYAIQEWIGVVGIDRIEGDFYNVMGLPISKVVKELQRF